MNALRTSSPLWARACAAWPGSLLLEFRPGSWPGRRKIASFCLLLCCLCLLQHGCAYSIYEDPRLMDTMAEDKALATSIKTALLRANFTGGMAIAVYAFYGNVFLVGEVPKNMQARALEIARSFKPASLTPHWFAPGGSEGSDLGLASALRAELIGTRGLSSTRIDTEVNAGRVVLLGVVRDNAEKQLAISVARRVKGVKSVTSYLLTPPKAGSV